MSAERKLPDRLAHVRAGIDFDSKMALAWHLRRARAALRAVGATNPTRNPRHPPLSTAALVARAKNEIELCLQACDHL